LKPSINSKNINNDELFENIWEQMMELRRGRGEIYY
jgi:hypothetical protein